MRATTRHIKYQSPPWNIYELLTVVLTAPIIVSQVAWLFHVPFFPLLILVTAVLIAWMLWKYKRESGSARPRWGTPRLRWPIVLGTALVVLFSVTPFAVAVAHHPDGSDLAGLQMYGFDDEAHFNLVKDIAHYDKLLYPAPSLHASPAAYSLATYPQGWHALSSIPYAILLGLFHLLHLSYPTNEVAAYTVIKVGWYALLSVVSYALIIELVRMWRGQFETAREYTLASIAAVAMTVLLQLTLLLSITLSGFQSYVGDLVFIGLMFILVVRTLQTKATLRTFVMPLLCALGISSTWFINILLILVALYVAFVQSARPSLFAACTSYVKLAVAKSNWRKTVGVIILGVLILIPPAVTFMGGSGSGLLNTPGGIAPINVSLIAWLAAISLAGLALLRPVLGATVRVWTLLASPVIVWALVEAYQLATVGSLSYYYQKTGETVLYGIFILFAAVLIAHLLGISRGLRLPTGKLMLPTCLSVVLLATLLPINFGLVHEYVGSVAINKFSSEQDRTLLLHAMATNHSADFVSFFANNTEDQTFNNFLSAVSDSENPYRRIFTALDTETQVGSFAHDLSLFANTSPGHVVQVVGTNESLAKLRHSLPATGSSNIVFVSVE